MKVNEFSIEDYQGVNTLKRPIFAVRSEHILPFFSDDAILDSNINELIDVVSKNTVVVERDLVEKNEDYIHPIMYCPIFTKVEDEIHTFVYQRTKGVGESRLLGMHSIGIGGHVDWTIQDAYSTNYINNRVEQFASMLSNKSDIATQPSSNDYLEDKVREHILQTTLFNEFREEIKEFAYLKDFKISAPAQFNDVADRVEKIITLENHPFALNLVHGATNTVANLPIIAIHDRSNEVGKAHLGFVNPIIYTGDRRGVYNKIEMGEESLISRGFLALDKALDSLQFESWSELIIKHILNCLQVNPNYQNYFNEMINDRIDHEGIRKIKNLGTEDPETGLNANIDFLT